MRHPTVHRSTWIVVLGAVIPVILLNVPGEIVSPSPINYGGGYKAEYVHGWPWVSLYRSVHYVFSKPGQRDLPDFPQWGVPWLAGTSWAFWQRDKWKLHVGALVGDAVVGILLITFVATAWEWRRRRRGRWLQFTLREMVVAMTLIAAAFGWRWHGKAEFDREDSASNARGVNVHPVYLGPLWFKRLFGESLMGDAFFRVQEADVEVTDGKQFREALSAIRGLPNLRVLNLIDRKERLDDEIPFQELIALNNLRVLVLDNFILTKDDANALGILRQLDQMCVMDWDNQVPGNLVRLMGALRHCRFTQDGWDNEEWSR